MKLGLEDKVVLITGGSRGIGLATAGAFVREGARVFLCARGEEGVASAARALGVTGFAADVATEQGAAQAVARTLSAAGRLDVLVNNVGGSLGAGRFDEVDAAKWREAVDVNLMSAVWCSQHAVEAMKATGGVIVHVNSICGREYCNSAPYTAAKSAVTALTKEMAIDLARYRIRVNGVAPGSILFEGGTWDQRRKAHPGRIQKMLEEALPWGRFGQPEEVGAAIVFLASDPASWISGATLPVDGAQGRAY
jgi:3-oxoacyl-[acyl-carrier protein] reductase